MHTFLLTSQKEKKIFNDIIGFYLRAFSICRSGFQHIEKNKDT